MFGAIISATDPVAVVSLLKELGASRTLSTLIEGESLINDGTAFVMFTVMLDLTKGEKFDAGNIILDF
jgi:NhaP-type Na+/H+ or K+/H+ antiporter